MSPILWSSFVSVECCVQRVLFSVCECVRGQGVFEFAASKTETRGYAALCNLPPPPPLPHTHTHTHTTTHPTSIIPEPLALLSNIMGDSSLSLRARRNDKVSCVPVGRSKLGRRSLLSYSCHSELKDEV